MNATQMSMLMLGGLAGLLVNLPAAAQEKAAPKAPVQIVLGPGSASAIPTRNGCVGFVHTGGGDIQITQPAPNVLVVTMLGSALAKGQLTKESVARWSFDMAQQFELVCQPGIKEVTLSIEGRLIGLLQSGPCCHKKASATADVGNAQASVSHGEATLVSLTMPPRAANCGLQEAVHLREGPNCQTVPPGCYTLHQTLDIGATVRKCPLLCKAVAAEFAPSHALDPAWIGIFDPFHGTIDKDFGFRVTLRAVPK